MGIFSLPFSKGSGSPLIAGVGFFIMLAGFMVIFVGYITYSKAKREWNLFYNMRDQIDNPDVIRRTKDLKRGKIMIIVGVVLVVLSLFIN